MALSQLAVDKAKPKEKAYKLADADGLYLLVKPVGPKTPYGSKLWQMKYYFMGKDKPFSIGPYPEVSLAQAREKTKEARKLLKTGIDPTAHKQQEKTAALTAHKNTFRALAEEWHTKNIESWDAKHAAKILRRMELHLFPDLGKRPIKSIMPAEVYATLQKIEGRGTTDVLHRVHQTACSVFSFAIITGRAEINPAIHIKGSLKPHKGGHFAMIEPQRLGEMLRALDAVDTSAINRLAVKLLLHTFLRPGELRHTQWHEVDFAQKQIVVPKEKTKMKIMEHVVPLTPQVVAMLNELKELGAGNPYLFPSQNRQKNLTMSENTVNNVLRRMGFGGQQVGHAFRALASTVLNESGKFQPDAIERQLSHSDRDLVRAAYNRAKYLEERVKIMAFWSDHLEAVAKEKPPKELADAQSN
jgi:integrase